MWTTCIRRIENRRIQIEATNFYEDYKLLTEIKVLKCLKKLSLYCNNQIRDTFQLIDCMRSFTWQMPSSQLSDLIGSCQAAIWALSFCRSSVMIQPEFTNSVWITNRYHHKEFYIIRTKENGFVHWFNSNTPQITAHIVQY